MVSTNNYFNYRLNCRFFYSDCSNYGLVRSTMVQKLPFLLKRLVLSEVKGIDFIRKNREKGYTC